MRGLVLLLLLGLSQHSLGINDGLHLTPMMGFSSWNTFFAENNEEKMIGIADAIKRLGLDEYGYIYLTVDDYWMTPDRDADGNMQTDLTRFPNGMRYVSDYFHDLGLKFGIYSDAGYKTCGGMAASLGYEQQDMDLFLSFEIDYLKYDNCWPVPDQINNFDEVASFNHKPSNYQDPHEEDRFRPMGDVLFATKPLRNITFELCLYGYGNVEEWGPDMGHLWRTSGDIRDDWTSVLANIDRNDEGRFLLRQGPTFGAWNYPDALFVGKGGMTDNEYRSMFALWCAVKSPLMLGSDLRQMQREDEAYKIITNTELLAINQDPLGVQATCVKDCCGRDTIDGGMDTPNTCAKFRNAWQVWKGPLSGNAYILVVVNRFDSDQNIEMDWSADAHIPEGRYLVKDLWSHQYVAVINVSPLGGEKWAGTLEMHNNWAFKLEPATPLIEIV